MKMWDLAAYHISTWSSLSSPSFSSESDCPCRMAVFPLSAQPADGRGYFGSSRYAYAIL